MQSDKVRCEECGWTGLDEDILVAPNPFDPSTKIHGCPSCRDVVNFVPLCDEPGCKEPVTRVRQMLEGLRLTCAAHVPK
jgi:hypothetical protein